MDGSPPTRLARSGDGLSQRVERLRRQIAETRQRLQSASTGFATPPAAQRGTDEVRTELLRAHEQAALMQAWAQDNESQLASSREQLQQALLAQEQQQRECSDLRNELNAQKQLSRQRQEECQALAHELAVRDQAKAQLEQKVAELEASLVDLRHTVSEQGELLRASERREESLRRRLKDNRNR